MTADTRFQVEQIENTLRALWMDILEIQSVSSDDDFFHCGGNSLAAIELLIRIQRELSVSLSPDTIYLHPTFGEQVRFLAKTAGSARNYHPLIIPLQAGGVLAPLFCIHPLGGWLDHYLKILPVVDSARPVFGIRARGLAPGEELPTTVEGTVREEVDAIRSVREQGPYHLIGFSNGGIIAYELACQLQDAGKEVGFLGLIDISAPATEVRYFKTLAAKFFPGPLNRIPAFAERHLKEHPNNPVYRVMIQCIRTAVHGIYFRSGGKALQESERKFHENVNWHKDALEKYPEGSRSHMRTQLNASRTYIPHRFRGDLILFSTRDDPIIHPGDPTRGWGSLVTGQCTVIPVPGNHTNLFDEPQLGVLNERIRETLGNLP